MNSSAIDFNQLKERILPYFIEIYGEEVRDIIVSRMNRIEPIFHSTIDNKKSAMYNKQSTKRVELTLKFLEHNNIPLLEEARNEMIKKNNTLALSKIPEAKRILSACFGRNEYRENTFDGIKDIPREPNDKEYVINRSVEVLKNLGVSVSAENYNKWVLTDEAKQTFERIDKLKEYIETLNAEFRDFDKQFDELKILIDKSKKIERNTHEKYMVEFLKSIEQYTTEHDKQVLEHFIASDKKDWYSFKKEIDIFKVLGDSFYDKGLLEAFSSKAIEKLNNPKTPKFTKQSIIENRIKYYRLIGIYKDQMPQEEFVLSSETIANAPPQQFVDDIISKKEHFGKLAEDEFLSITSSYKDNVEKINSLGLITNVNFKIDDIKNRALWMSPNIRMVNGQPEPVALLFFSPDSFLPEFIDTMFIHEINHAIELSLINYVDGKAFYKCGFEFLSDDENEAREYKEFSEVINQMITIEITEAMHRDNVYLFDNPNTSKTRGGTYYEEQRTFIEVFWEKFRKVIMIARINNNLDSLFNVVGKENFDTLKDIINEYSALPYFTMLDDIINKRTTELTEKRIDLINSAIKTCDVMIERAQQLPGYENLTERTI